MGQYDFLSAQLVGRNYNGRKICNNTYLERRGDNIVVRLHSTDVVIFTLTGDMSLNSGGWLTVTTKERINRYLPEGYCLCSERGRWILSRNYPDPLGEKYMFQDGITITSTDKVVGAGQATPKADRELKYKISKYAKLCADAVPMNPPDNGDCWYCVMQTDGGDSLGDALKDNSHLESHMEEGYVVPSLVLRALREQGNTNYVIGGAFSNQGFFTDIAKERIQVSVRRYILKRFGFGR